MSSLVQVVNLFAELLILLVILSAILSYFMDPYHPVRRGVDNIVEPLLAPIRRVIPPLGVIDISPLILILLIQLASRLVIGLLQ